jgi:hypothetical protein
VENDLLGLEGLDDESYGAGEQVGLAPDLLGKRQLIQRPDADLLQRAACARLVSTHLECVVCESCAFVVPLTAGRAVDEIDAFGLDQLGQPYRVLDGGATLNPVRARQSQEQRLRRGPHLAHRPHHLQRESCSVLHNKDDDEEEDDAISPTLLINSITEEVEEGGQTSKLPPYSSVRWLASGELNEERR